MITEIVTFETMEDVSYEEFVNSVDMVEREFHSKQPGFIDTELLYDSKHALWVMIQHWESIEVLKSASKKMFTESKTEAFRKALNTKSVKMSTYPLIKAWEKQTP